MLVYQKELAIQWPFQEPIDWRYKANVSREIPRKYGLTNATNLLPLEDPDIPIEQNDRHRTPGRNEVIRKWENPWCTLW